MLRALVLTIAVAAGAWASAAPVAAYLDPGAGSALLQMLIGGAAIVTGVVAAYWQRIRSLWARRRGHDRSHARD